MKFAPLHIISGYSFLKSGLTIEKIVKSVTKNNYYGAALVDEGVLYGIPSFVKEMEKVQKPFLVGLTIILKGCYLSLYAIDEQSYLSLINVTYLNQIDEVKVFDYLKNNKTNLVGVLDTNRGYFKDEFTNGDISFNKKISEISSFFSSFYLGLEITSKEEKNQAEKIRSFASEHLYETIAFPTIRYQTKKDAIVLKIVNAISYDEKISERTFEGEEYFYSISNYQKIYTEQELENTGKIIDLSSFNYHQKRGEMLHYECDDPISELKNKSFKGLKEKNLDKSDLYIKRLEKELDVIISMGYASYFLIVSDYVNYAKNHQILVGPARGSAASSLVAYLLNITEIDPLKYDLLFERFLNKGRKTLPDIDVDFMDNRREEMVQYMRNKYGNDLVSGITTFQTILAKQALRDIGRVYDIPTRHIDLLCKKLTNNSYSLRDSYRNLPSFKNLVDSDKYYLDIVSLASKIEGLPRQSGVHAAGIILNNSPIEKVLPVSIDLDNHFLSQYEMNYLEEQGFLKMDFLGLRTLSIISDIVDLINLNHPENKLDKFNIPFDTKEVYDLISSGQTVGIFQLESSGMKSVIKKLKPNCFNDVVALLALYRPGPMDSIKTYIKRKEGLEKVTYVSKEIEDVLKSTYGIIVYQEQISQIASLMAGLSLIEADNFRRAISKKEESLLSSLKDVFINGSLKNGYSLKAAEETFNLIYKFAHYGFNKAHSVGYSYLACRMAYLKYFYPLEFYSIILDNHSVNSDTKFNESISEMKLRGFKIISPDINESISSFFIKDNRLIFPLSRIKGVNENLLRSILFEREQGKYTSFYDFVKRLYPYNINKNQIISLIDAGAFDNLYKSRNSLRNSVDAALQYGDVSYSENGQTSLDLGIEPPEIFISHDDPLENLDKEYNALGIMLSNNPLEYKHDLLRKYDVIPIVNLVTKCLSTIAGIIKSKKIILTKKGDNMAFIKIFDETGEIEIIVFPNLYQNIDTKLEINTIVLIKGYLENKNESVHFIAENIQKLEE